MKYFKNSIDGEIYAFEPDGSQDHLIKPSYESLSGYVPPTTVETEQQADCNAVKHALQAHIDSVAVGLGFSNGNAVMLYAGFANTFQPLAQAFGTWEAGIWVAANQYMAQVKAGEAPMLTPEQVVARIPIFVMPEIK